MFRGLLVWIFFAAAFARQTSNYVHPIVIDGKHFVDSVTNDRFYIRGIDYQPGGSAAYDKLHDPLSDAETCARDISLMQRLGINTVRVYTVNPDLNHDACMTMLAAAEIYLVLDVNSPFLGESINRYEPWTTYTPQYLQHVFEVVDSFTRYNNTLAFFIGNEIVNDERSAAVSPPYVRAVTRDVKDYMYYNCPRMVPLGYSAADDLRFRTQLPHYLTCGEKSSAVDFYGVNSYQWCGYQTMKTSGYDVLVQDHAQFDFPVFFSEFGCNHIQPRPFQEVDAIFSPAMTPYFEGGLVYEFSQETNDYGLVSIDHDGDARLLPDFETLQSRFENAKQVLLAASPLPTEKVYKNQSVPATATTATTTTTTTSRAKLTKQGQLTLCKSEYSNLPGAALKIPESFGTEMIRNGVHSNRGSYLPALLTSIPKSTYRVYNADGTEITNLTISITNNFSAHASEVVWLPRTGKPSAGKPVATKFDMQITQKHDQSEANEKPKKGTNVGTKPVPVSVALPFIIGALFYLV